MRVFYKILLPILFTLGVAAVVVYVLATKDIAVLHPHGTIAEQQRNLLVGTVALSMIVIVPVFFLTFFIAWKYREGNKKARYTPNWSSHKGLELTWWAIPTLIIVALAIITWVTSHTLDPYRPLKSDKQSLRVQVVALQWKWLFIYPDQHIATVNYLELPVNTPVDFEITADAPMNSFWIPQLGGQVYAMTGMSTQLHLQANEPGSYSGSSANISGEGFADMKFTARAVSKADFTQWVAQAQQSDQQLTSSTYTELAKPSRNNPHDIYMLHDATLYDTIVMKYMTPPGKTEQSTMEGMSNGTMAH